MVVCYLVNMIKSSNSGGHQVVRCNQDDGFILFFFGHYFVGWLRCYWLVVRNRWWFVVWCCEVERI